LPAGDERRPALKARERDLWTEHGDAWAGPLRRWAADCTFRRGFAERVTVAARVFLDHADELFCLAPVREVAFAEVERLMPALAASRHLARLTALDFRDNRLGTADAVALAASPHLAGLMQLDLSWNRVGTGGVQALAGSPHLGRLASLRLAANDVGATGVEVLAGSRQFGALKVLDLRENNLGSAGVQALALARHLSSLTSLNLGSNR